MKNYEIIDHTADLGLRVYGESLKELFSNAAKAMFETIADIKDIRPRQKIKINLKEETVEDLFVAWLRELLYQFNVNYILFSDFSIQQISFTSIKASARGEKFDVKTHPIKTELKAVTYHGLKVERINSSWQAEVIFDI